MDAGDAGDQLGYLPRADARDVLVRQAAKAVPEIFATGSPRRRLQLAAVHFPQRRSIEIRGNVDTRLRKIADGLADAATVPGRGRARPPWHQILAWIGILPRSR